MTAAQGETINYECPFCQNSRQAIQGEGVTCPSCGTTMPDAGDVSVRAESYKAPQPDALGSIWELHGTGES